MDTTILDRSGIYMFCLSNCCLPERPRTLSVTEINRSRWKEFGYKSGTYTLPPIFAFLIDLYDGKDIVEGLESCRINPDFTPGHPLRNDLEFYIPQLTNFIAFHEDFLCNKLNVFLTEASKADPFFAHSYYWYINSLLPAIDQEKAQSILKYIIQECSSEPLTQLFTPHYEKFDLGLQKNYSPEQYQSKLTEIEHRKEQAARVIQSYKADDLNITITNFEMKATDLDLKCYVSPLSQEDEEDLPSNPFTSTILFLDDLYVVAEDLIRKQLPDKLGYLKSALNELNKNLPACVYMPFVNDSLRYYAVLNIVVDETRIFSTKERAPFYICLEVFRPQEELAYEYNELFDIKESPPKVKKKKTFMGWAKKAFKIKKKEKRGRTESRRDNILTKEPEEQFKLGHLTEFVSSPLTLKRIYRSQEGLGFWNDQNSKNNTTQSLIVHSSHMNNSDLLHHEESKTTDNFKGRFGMSARMSRFRKSTADAYNMRTSLGYQEEGSIASSEVSGSNSKDAKSARSSFANKLSSTKEGGQTSQQDLKLSPNIKEPLLEEEKDDDSRLNSERGINDDELPPLNLSQDDSLDFFGEDSNAQAIRIKANSPFRYLKSWRLIHAIVKTGADMKEEQFAVQLISQFDQIFRDEKVKLILTPYEIISLGSDFGIVEVLKDTITMSKLKEKMYRQNIFSLNEFFVKYYGEDIEKARKRFCRSLAAYSLVCYFLQIKDRHNGNIMFHKLGHIMHIDFGFLLSNSPGKGIEFERKVPFKLLNEYVEVLGGPRSSLFQEFRRRFYKGFMAARKHQEQILILVKMMYSTQGANLPCFKAGMRAITELEQRFNPPGVHERDLPAYCYNLINQSLDNWRAKCYDKYQYHFQGIFY